MVPFLAGGVPNLGFNDLIFYANASGGEFYADGGLWLQTELVARESR